jgi:hypothetical protein
VRTGIERGEFSENTPVDIVVRTTIAVLDGLQQQWLLDSKRMSMVAEFSGFVATLKARWASALVTG